MRQFPIPFDMQSEDKVIGGYLSLRQFFWLFTPVIAAILLLIMNKGYLIHTGKDLKIIAWSLTLRLVIIILVAIVGIIMAFLKIKGITADKYLTKVIKYKLRNHSYKYGR